jgi:DNA-binding transcriptional regulator LsrR (DeoR family)
MSILERKFIWRRPEAERKRLPNTLSQVERDRVRIGLRYLRIRYGRGELAKRMGLTREALRKTLKRAPTMRVAVLVAFVADVELDRVLTGKWPGEGCPTCGGTGRCRG